MKRFLILFLLMTFSLGYSQGLSQDFESGGINGAPFASGAAPAVTIEAGPGTNTTQVVKFVGNTGSALWQGVNLSLTTNVNLTAATTRTMSIDVYASGPLFFLVKVNGGLSGAPEAAAVVEYTGTNTWQTCSFTFNSVRDGKAAAANGTYTNFVLHAYWPSAAATTFPPGNATARTLYVDNISGPLALPSATVGTFTVPSKIVGDATFTITPPTSNNTSAFTYASSNTAVGTIVNGNQIQVGSSGYSTITASQVSDGTYSATSSTATFTVTPSPPPSAPTPPARNAWDVVSLYSDSYTATSGATWQAGSDILTSVGNNARYFNGFTLARLAFAARSISTMTTLHIDVYTINQNQLWFEINGNRKVVSSIPLNGWASFDIPLTDYVGLNLGNVSFFDLNNPTGAAAPVKQVYLDNIYFYRLPLLTGNMYINDGTFAAGDFCSAAGQDIADNDGTAAKPFATLAYALTRSSQAAGTIFYVDAGTYSWPATHTFTASGTVGNPITIQGKGSATNITSTTSTNSGLYFTTGSNWVVKDLNWTATNARSVFVESATGISLENCTFNFTSSSASLQSIIINNAAGKLTIKNCTLTRSNTAFHMIEVVAGTSLTLQDNTIRFSALAAVGTASSVHVATNAASVLIMERNKLFGGGYGVGFIAAGTIAANASTIIKNNFFSSNWGIVNTQLTGLKVYNNSFYTANNCLYGITPAFMNNWDIQNNILYTYGAKACVFVNATTAATMNYNHYYYPNVGVGSGAVNLNGTTSSLASWKASANPVAIRETNGQGGNANADNPLYLNISSLATTDLHLQPASPTIDVGSDVGVTDDIDGNARPLGGTYDIGADESVPGSPAITNFPAISKVMGDAPFTLGTPTSNSSGTWTYSITTGNGSVATISGNTVTLVAPGTAVVRATQAADGTYSSGFIEANLTVTPSPFPLTAAPGDPGKNSWDVISLFSAAYTDVAGTNFNPSWGQTSNHPNNLTTPSYGGDEVKQYQNTGNYQGTETAADINVSAMTKFHIEIYSSTLTSIRVSLIKTTGGNVEVPTTLALTPNQWNVFDIDISGASFSAIRPVFRQIKYDQPAGAGNIQNLIVDNLFFWRPATTLPPTLGAFTVPDQIIGASPFSLTDPTSNSAGAFSYTSSNTSVATIIGNTVTVVGAGTSTITATQAANGSYGTGSTTATLNVTPPAAPTPPVRNTWDVISLYSNAYTTSSSASWGVVGTDVSISGNNTRLLSGSPTYRLPFTATNVSEMTTLHIDVYALNQASWQFRLNDKAVTKSTPVNGWTSIDILLSEYAPQSLNLTNVSFFDFFNPNGANPNTSYVDNIYFYKPASLPPPTLGSLTLPSPVSVGDAPFVLTNPTTNSTGTFSYTSSNTAVATVSGNTLTFVGGGTSVITCTVASDGVYGARSTSATLTVTFPLPGPSPIPPVRDPLSVVSLYTGTQPTYANVVNATQASWSTGSTTSNFNFTNGTNTCVQVNNLGFFGLVGASNFSVVGMTTMHVDIYVNTPMTMMILNLLAPADRIYSIGPLTTGWNSFDIPLTTYPGALNNIAGIKFEQSGGTPRQIYIDNVYFYKQDTWLGTTNSAWATTSNWASGAVPTATSDVVIATGANQPVISSDVSISSLTINSGTTLTVNAGKKLTLSGNLTNNGTINFKSDVNGTAMFGAFNGIQSGTGVVTVERYIPSGKRAFRLLSPAVTTTTFISGNWQGQTHITGGASGGFDVSETNNPSMFTYNNQVASGTGWTPIANTNATNLTAGVGYRMLVRGDRTPTNITAATTDNMNAAITLSATGTLKTGTVTLDATSTPAINNTANTTTADYSLVGNPYQSAVDWNAVTKSGIEATYWAWDPNMGTSTQRGRYVAFNGTTNDNVDSEVEQFIQPGQAFFVKNTTSGTAGTLTFEEAHKATTNADVFRTNNQTESTNFATLSMQLYDPNELAIGGYPIDATKAVFGSEYTNQLGLGDATKLEAAGENIAWFRNNTKLAIDAAAPVTTSDELIMKTLRLGANKNYTFKIQTTNFDTALTPYLVDNFLNTQTEISTSQAYLATFATTSNVASYSENRFKVVFQNAVLNSDNFANQVGLYPNPSKGNGFYLQLHSTAQVTVKLYNTLGQEIAISHNEGHYQAKQSLAAGVYHIMVTQGEKTSKLKWIVE